MAKTATTSRLFGAVRAPHLKTTGRVARYSAAVII
jgi:hypothetical protein